MSKDYEERMYRVNTTLHDSVEGKIRYERKPLEQIYEETLSHYRDYMNDSQALLPMQILKELIRGRKVSEVETLPVEIKKEFVKALDE